MDMELVPGINSMENSISLGSGMPSQSFGNMLVYLQTICTSLGLEVIFSTPCMWLDIGKLPYPVDKQPSEL